jgi:hypothetical protein
MLGGLLGPRLFALARLRVDLREQLGDLALLHERVDVQHRLVAGREDRLVLQQVQDLRRAQRVRVSEGRARAGRAELSRHAAVGSWESAAVPRRGGGGVPQAGASSALCTAAGWVSDAVALCTCPRLD